MFQDILRKINVHGKYFIKRFDKTFLKKDTFKTFFLPPEAKEAVFYLFNAALNLLPAHTIKGFGVVVFHILSDTIHNIFLIMSTLGKGFTSVLSNALQRFSQF